MKKFKFFNSAILVFIASFVTAQNAVNNGDFELSTWSTNTKGSTPQEWTTNNTGMTNSRTAAVNGITPTQGTYMFSMKCNQNNSITSAILSKPNAAGGIVLKSGTSYIFSFKVYTVQGATVVPKMAFKMYSASPASTVYYFDNTASYFNVTPGSWQTFRYPFTATNTLSAGSDIPTFLGFFLNGNESNTIFYLDEVSIVENNPTITFANPISVSKINGDAAFTNLAASNSAGEIIYSSGTPSVATVNSSSGQVTIVGVGSSVITATQAANGNYNAGSQAYTLNVATRPIITISGTQTASVLTNPVADISVSANTELTIDAASTVHNITIEQGGKVTLNDNVTLNVNNITINSDLDGTGTFVDKNTTGLSVTGVVNQYLGTARNWYITSPVASTIVPSGQTYFSYDETGSNTDFSNSGTAYWKPETAGATLDPRKGYIVQASGATTLNFNGSLNTGNKSLQLSRTSGNQNEGFNLVANPYPSYLDWTMVSAANTGLMTTAWFRTKNASGDYIFTTVNVADPKNPTIVAVNPNTTITTLIPPMQAYWVRVKTAGTTNYLIDNSMRKHFDVAGNKFKAPKQNNQQLVRLQVSNGSNTDEAVILFNANATDGLDDFDSPKLSNNSLTTPEIYTGLGADKLVINGMNMIPFNSEIPIGFSSLQANNFSFSIKEMANFDADTRIILRDKINQNTETDITNGTPYVFSAPVTPANTNRFSILFRTPASVTDLKNIEKLNAHVFVNSANQITISTPEKCNYNIYNTIGQKVIDGITSSNQSILDVKLPNGMYLVKLTASGKILICKVIVK